MRRPGQSNPSLRSADPRARSRPSPKAAHRCRAWHRLSARSFGARPRRVLPEIGVAAGIPIGMGQRLLGQIGGPRQRRRRALGEGRGLSTGKSHKEIVEVESRTGTRILNFYEAREPRRMLSSSMGVVSNVQTRSSGSWQDAAAGFRCLDLDLERMAALAAFTARSLRTARPRPFGASIVHTKSGKLLLRALNQCGAGIRSKRPRRSARDSPGHQAAEENFAGRLHALHHLRTLPHVHEHGAVGGAGSRGLRRDHRRCKQALQTDSDSRSGGCRAQRHEMRRRRSGFARRMLRSFYPSPHAAGVSTTGPLESANSARKRR